MNSSTRLRRALEMGTTQKPGDLPLLIEQLGQEPDFFVRDMLTWAITRHPRSEAYPLLVSALDNKKAQSQVLHTLTKIAHPESWSVISHDLLHDPDSAIRTTTWRLAVMSVPDKQVEWLLDELLRELGKGDAETQRSLNRALAVFGDLAREKLQLLRTHADAAIDLIDDPERIDELHIDIARKVAVYGADGQD